MIASCRMGQRPCARVSHAAPRPSLLRRVIRPAASAEPTVSDAVSVSERPATKVTLKMPTGLVFTQTQEGGPVYVDEVTPNSPAEKGGIRKGDVITQCSAVVLKSGREGNYQENGHGDFLYDNWQVVMFDCRAQPFKSVMSALKSNNPRWGFKEVTMFFERPAESQA